MIDNAIKEGAILGSLSGSAMLGVIVVILSAVVWHLYKIAHKDNQEKTKELISETRRTNTLINEQIIAFKSSQDAINKTQDVMFKFIETHCSNTNNELQNIRNDLFKINDKITTIKEVRNSELNKIYRKDL
ncbi:hypothetical protein CA563_08530 [Campylobacter coli]|nr:hypothetical protein [Campylobacter coli]